MDQRTLDQFKKELLKRKNAIMQDANRTLNDEVHEQKEGMPDTVDRSSLETDRNFILKLRDRNRKLLKKLDEALKRIENKSFGICKDCGEKIDEQRIKARPVATLCIECKERQEEEEKLGV